MTTRIETVELGQYQQHVLYSTPKGQAERRVGMYYSLAKAQRIAKKIEAGGQMTARDWAA